MSHYHPSKLFKNFIHNSNRKSNRERFQKFVRKKIRSSSSPNNTNSNTNNRKQRQKQKQNNKQKQKQKQKQQSPRHRQYHSNTKHSPSRRFGKNSVSGTGSRTRDWGFVHTRTRTQSQSQSRSSQKHNHALTTSTSTSTRTRTRTENQYKYTHDDKFKDEDDSVRNDNSPLLVACFSDPVRDYSQLCRGFHSDVIENYSNSENENENDRNSENNSNSIPGGADEDAELEEGSHSYIYTGTSTDTKQEAEFLLENTHTFDIAEYSKDYNRDVAYSHSYSNNNHNHNNRRRRGTLDSLLFPSDYSDSDDSNDDDLSYESFCPARRSSTHTLSSRVNPMQETNRRNSLLNASIDSRLTSSSVDLDSSGGDNHGHSLSLSFSNSSLGDKNFNLSPHSIRSGSASASASPTFGLSQSQRAFSPQNNSNTSTVRTSTSTSTSIPQNKTTMRTIVVKCLRGITHNPLSACLLRMPCLADSLPTIPQIILQNPKMSFGVMLVVCSILDFAIILPAYFASYLITEYGVYALSLFSIWCLGKFVFRMIAFPGSTPRLRGEIETEVAKYSFRMLTNAHESILALATLLAEDDNYLFGSYDENGNGNDSSTRVMSKGESILGLAGRSYARFDVLPIWVKVKQYRDRVLGMYHDVFQCLLIDNGNGKGSHSDSERTPLTKYGNNPLVGDIGKLTKISPQAKADGLVLLKSLGAVLDDLDRLESCAGDYLSSDNMKSYGTTTLSLDGQRAAQRLLVSITEFGECLDSIVPSGLIKRDGNASDEDSEASDRRMRRKKSIVRQGFDNFTSMVVSTIEIFDPPPIKTIFGLDALRGSMLSRYQGAQQLWIPRNSRQGGGSIDAIHIPADRKCKQLSNETKLEKVVLFCNPNAGLLEVATGLSLIHGNVVDSVDSELTCWTDFYLQNGYDIVVFNYAGYGRSHVGRRKVKGDIKRGIHVARRIISSFLFGFKPSPSSLKSDATDAAIHIIETIGVDKFIIHGESIGGMAAAGAAKNISFKKYVDSNSLPVTYPTLLLCDRTFCNLNATAFRLVGSWTKNVLPLLSPFWNTDVAGDFVSARCRKVVAQDAADAIIHDASSLKKGIATAKEYTKGETRSIGTFGDIPLTYRMADFEQVGVQDSTIVKFHEKRIQAPSWPADKHIELSEAFHFAACARRIGKAATNIRKNRLMNSLKQSPYEDDEEGIEITAVFSRDDDVPKADSVDYDDIILDIWVTLGRCDGLCGLPLGAAVKDGHDCTMDWLSCMATLGHQRVALAAESRLKNSLQPSIKSSLDDIIIEDQDFNVGGKRYKNDEEGGEIELHPLPLPCVIKDLETVLGTAGDLPAVKQSE